jgi:hypothetical protein
MEKQPELIGGGPGAGCAVGTKMGLEIPSGVSSGLLRGRVRSLENSLEANHADNSRSNSSADHYPRRSWRNFRLVRILSKSTWLVTALSPGSEKMSRHTVAGGDIAGLFACFACDSSESYSAKANTLPTGSDPRGRAGWLLVGASAEQRSLIENYIVEAASIAMPRRHRPAKTDRIDGETLIRALMAWKRGEPRACSMVKLLSPEEDDNRRIGRERKTLIAERVFHVNRIKGLLFTQGIRDYQPVNRDRRQRLDELRTGDVARDRKGGRCAVSRNQPYGQCIRAR